MAFDLIFLGMFAIVIVMTWSIWLVRFKRAFRKHKVIQVGTSVALLAIVVLFEIEVRLISDWRELASYSPHYATGVVATALIVHLCFAIPTPVLWAVVLGLALKKFENPPRPNLHSRLHIPLARLAAAMMYGTATTGIIFYWLAFVA